DGIRYRTVTGVQTCAHPISMPAERTTAMIAVLKQRCVHESIPKIGSILPSHTGKRLSNDNVRISTARSGVVTECRLVRQSGINTTEHWESRGCRVGVQRFDILIGIIGLSVLIQGVMSCSGS